MMHTVTTSMITNNVECLTCGWEVSATTFSAGMAAADAHAEASKSAE